MHAAVNDRMKAHPEHGGLYGLKDPDFDHAAQQRVLVMCQRESSFKDLKVSNPVLQRAVGKYCNQSFWQCSKKSADGKYLKPDKLMAARAQERLKKAEASLTAPSLDTAKPASTETTDTSDADDGAAATLAPKRKSVPLAKAAAILKAAKTNKTLTPAAMRKKAKEDKKAAAAAEEDEVEVD